MQTIDIAPRVWQRVQEVRAGAPYGGDEEWSEAESAALELYGPLARRDRGSLFVGQVGQSLDGRVATESGDARDVSGPDGLVHLHRMRALVDAVVVGVRTALHDTPRLTVRLCEGDNPARVVIDPRGRLGNDSPIFNEDGVRRLVIQAVDVPRPDGVEVIHLPATNGALDPAAIRSTLHEAGLHTVLIEGGSFTLSRFIEAKLLNRLHVAISPIIIGGGPQGLTMPTPPARLIDAWRPHSRVFSLGSDVVFDCHW